MARIGISYEEVDRVATQLHQEGQTPTVQRIRNALGTGSNTTIARHLKAWQEIYFAENATRTPTAFPEELVTSVDGLWAAALAKADENYREFREQLDNERREAIEEKDAALLHLADIEQHNQQLAQELEKLQQALQQRNSEHERLQGQFEEQHKNFESYTREVRDTTALAQAAIEQASHVKASVDAQLAEQQQQHENMVGEIREQLHIEQKRYEALQTGYSNKVEEFQQTIRELQQTTDNYNRRIVDLSKSLTDQSAIHENRNKLQEQHFEALEKQYGDINKALTNTIENIGDVKKEVENVGSIQKTSDAQYHSLLNTLSKSNDYQQEILAKIINLETIVSKQQNKKNAD